MSKAAGFHDVILLPESGAGPTAEEVRLHLHKILDSSAFHGSKRSCQFLEYVCDKALAGESGSLKERTLAVEVFGRQPASDLGDDTIVRVGAREVRKRLAQYYSKPEAAVSKVRIELPSGSYVPAFRYAESAKVAVEDSPVVALPIPRLTRRPRWLPVVGAVLLIALSVALAQRWSAASPNAEAFQLFWAPVFQASEPLLVAVGHPLVYRPSARAIKLSEDRLPPMAVPMQRPLQLLPKEMDGSDMLPVANQYVGFGDMVTATDVAAMLARKSRDVRLRLANSVQFADLRQGQTLLIGAFTNRWTMELEQSWRYQFRWTVDRRAVITDTLAAKAAGRHEWGFTETDDGSALKDYILISRMANSSAGGLVIVAAGVKQFGTEAAGRLLIEPEQFGAILRKLPVNWETKNMQILLEARVIGNTPAEPEVVGWHVW